MRVDSSKPFKLVYSLCRHEFLGYLIEPHVVQINQDGGMSLTYNRLFTNTASDYSKYIDEIDWKLIKLCEDIEQGNIIKRFYKKNIRPSEYFSRIFNEELFAIIRPKIEETLQKIFDLLTGKPFYLMSKEGWPVEANLSFASQKASVLFHFRRSEHELRYFPTLKYDGYRIEFMYKGAEIITNDPACLLLENTLYFFDQEVEGRKLAPFLNRRYISIPKSTEQSYFKKFIAPLIERYHVYAEGFEIKTHKYQAVPLIEFRSLSDRQYDIKLKFKYDSYIFSEIGTKPVSVRVSYDTQYDRYTFYRIKRSMMWERAQLDFLEKLGLKRSTSNRLELREEINNSGNLLDWLNRQIDVLVDHGFEISQKKSDKKYVFGQMKVNLEVEEGIDWFDIKATIQFGEFLIPFVKLKKYILNNEQEFVLPSGEIAIIPEQWFNKFNDLFYFADDKEGLKLQKQHIGIISGLDEDGVAGLSMKRKIEKLTHFESLEDVDEPKLFHGTLRPYQKAGYNWFWFLKRHHFGGCLADDMGLGKTVQTLALLQKEKEESVSTGREHTSLIIMPTSLIYNWLKEAEKFAPDLRILNHTGTTRAKASSVFTEYDIVISTYGIARIDTDILEDFLFHYIILDESQYIKNVTSKAFKSIQRLRGNYRLILSGTPIENSVADLWSQMTFVNPGLLGSYTFFMREYVTPIEKKKDEKASMRLQTLIKPFVLRRTKDQVAKELPEKSEKIFYCGMSESQADYYSRIKAEYRNMMLRQLDEGTFKRSGIQVIKGLSQLRQLANHPQLIDDKYQGTSGKFESVIQTLETVLIRGHKVLIFSQFVKQMKIYANYFKDNGIAFSYLDGATQNRQNVIDEYRESEEIKVFLISIKAGGVGLNLTEADYVFILDPWWNPAVEMQAIDRTHRIGQTKKVFIYKFITKDTVEEKILALQRNKQQLATSLIKVEESFVKSLTEADIAELLS
ncbi:DEAD/DEAH box helicase [Albibacterium indicum]|uniref:DEAD/DEAH box helicase n=1 Tax=Albibacterium indicum TaxID=2292082 RepID=UPI000E4AE284|nr:DEAD/DEAH box helicase [Pedobacter indicus]